MRKILKLGILSVLSGCMQPGNIEIVKSSATPQVIAASNKPQAQVNANVDTNTTIKQPEGSLISKGNEPSTVVVAVSPTPIVTPTPFYYTNNSSYPNSTSTNNNSNDSPIKPEDRGQGQPATPCDGYGQTSQQCLNYLESQKPPKPPYSVAYPVPGGLTNAEIGLVFKDEYKIRYIRSENKFISLNGTDVSSINNLLIDNEHVYSLFGSSLNAEIDNNSEKLQEEKCNCDIPNSLSMISFILKNIDVAEFVLNLRNNSLVREANPSGTTTGA